MAQSSKSHRNEAQLAVQCTTKCVRFRQVNCLMALIVAVPSCHSFGITRIPLAGKSCKFIFENILKICRENSRFIKL